MNRAADPAGRGPAAFPGSASHRCEIGVSAVADDAERRARGKFHDTDPGPLRRRPQSARDDDEGGHPMMRPARSALQ